MYHFLIWMVGTQLFIILYNFYTHVNVFILYEIFHSKFKIYRHWYIGTGKFSDRSNNIWSVQCKTLIRKDKHKMKD